MPEALGIVVVVVALAACVWLSVSTQNQLKQLRAELDQTQRQLNELKVAVEAVPPPPAGLPRARSSPSRGLDDLREQLRAAHSEEAEAPADE
jgi:predicted  nucleic acid-binding Zn-ribbon protein